MSMPRFLLVVRGRRWSRTARCCRPRLRGAWRVTPGGSCSPISRVRRWGSVGSRGGSRRRCCGRCGSGTGVAGSPAVNGPGGLHAHHLVHWANGGGTDLENLVLLCGDHHRFVHEGGWTISGDPGGVVQFITRHGRPYAPKHQPLDRQRMARLVAAATGRPAWWDHLRPPAVSSPGGGGGSGRL
jgi:hypothetical protein